MAEEQRSEDDLSGNDNESVQSPGAQNGNDDVAQDEAGDKSTMVTIRVVNQMGDTMKFRTKRTSLIHRLLDVYCQHKNVRKKELRFRYDGHSIAESATPETLGMEDDEVIEVFSEQIGGAHEMM